MRRCACPRGARRHPVVIGLLRGAACLACALVSLILAPRCTCVCPSRLCFVFSPHPSPPSPLHCSRCSCDSAPASRDHHALCVRVLPMGEGGYMGRGSKECQRCSAALERMLWVCSSGGGICPGCNQPVLRPREPQGPCGLEEDDCGKAKTYDKKREEKKEGEERGEGKKREKRDKHLLYYVCVNTYFLFYTICGFPSIFNPLSIAIALSPCRRPLKGPCGTRGRKTGRLLARMSTQDEAEQSGI